MSRKATRQVEAPSFASKLRQALAEDELTAEDFSRRIDRTLRTVQRWRAGTSEPSAADLMLVARSLNRDPAWFFDAEEQAA